MKGVVFTEFLQLVEEKFGYEVVDQVLVESNLENQGAYTAVGTYDYNELIQMVVALSQNVGIEVPVLVKTFGRHLFEKFAEGYATKISGFQSSFDLIEQVEDYIHVEVRKLYPEAELPTFTYQHIDDETLVMTYESSRPFADLCEGLIEKCIEHFGNDATCTREDLLANGTKTKFTLERIPAKA